MKSILFISYKFFPDIGGIEVNSEILCREFTKKGYRLTLVTTSAADNDKDFPFTVCRNPSFSKLVSLFRTHDFVFENNPSMRLSWPIMFYRKKNVVAIRTELYNRNGKMGIAEKVKMLRMKRANRVIAISNYIANTFFPAATVIGNPYRSELFYNGQQVKKQSFVFLGRLVSDKGADMAIDALATLIHLYPDQSEKLELTIIGDGPEREKLQQQSNEKGISGNIKFLGMLSGQALTSELQAHAFLLVPSRWREPFGNVALEGMACGCIPIVSDGGGLVDAVGNAGLVFKRGDVASLVNKMQELLSNEHLQTTLRKNAVDHLLQHRSDKVAGKYLQVIQMAYDA